jgi:hypothetical protein
MEWKRCWEIIQWMVYIPKNNGSQRSAEFTQRGAQWHEVSLSSIVMNTCRGNLIYPVFVLLKSHLFGIHNVLYCSVMFYCFSPSTFKSAVQLKPSMYNAVVSVQMLYSLWRVLVCEQVRQCAWLSLSQPSMLSWSVGGPDECWSLVGICSSATGSTMWRMWVLKPIRLQHGSGWINIVPMCQNII